MPGDRLCAVPAGTGNGPCGTGGITKSWVGGDPGGSPTDWANPANWNPTGVPAATDAVLIPITANSPVLSVNRPRSQRRAQSPSPNRPAAPAHRL